MKKKSFALFAAAALAAIAAGCTAPAATTEEPVASAVAVEVAAVVKGTVDDAASLTGTLEAIDQVEVGPKISGNIANIQVDIGQRVNAGDVLFTLDSTDLETAVRQARASYESAVASLRSAESSSGQGLLQAQNGVTQAQQAYDDQQLELNRTKELFEVGAASQQQLEQAETAAKNAELALLNAKKTLETAEAGTSITVAEASVNQARVQLETAEANLAYATVTAPISGIVSSKTGNIGTFASPQSPVVTLIDTATVLVKTTVAESEVPNVKPGNPVEVTIPAAGKTVQATITAVSPSMDTQLKAYPVEISIPNDDGALLVDMVAEVRFLSAADGSESKLIVPGTAIVQEGGKSFVYKVVDNKAVMQEITVGKRSGGMVEVQSGLTEGENVVSKGVTLISDGAEVAVQS